MVAHHRITSRRAERHPRDGEGHALPGDRPGLGSSHVVVRRSEFRHCGDRSPLFSNCLHLKPGTRHIRILHNWFHDCRGCDFIHGRFGYDLTLRGNRFERALPCRMDRHRCGHQDLVSFWSGNRLLVERNTFGVYKLGAAQLYLIGGVDRVSIVNNVFRGTDPKVPGYRARVAIIVGSKGSKRVPRRVRIVNNTILTGARRIDGYAGSIRMSGVYWGMQRASDRSSRTTSSASSRIRTMCAALPAGGLERRAARSCVPRPESGRPGASRFGRPADCRVDPAHRPREQAPRRPARHRRSPAGLSAGHRSVRVSRAEAEELTARRPLPCMTAATVGRRPQPAYANFQDSAVRDARSIPCRRTASDTTGGDLGLIEHQRRTSNLKTW